MADIATVAVLGDYLFIEGGQINQYINGVADTVESRQGKLTGCLGLRVGEDDSDSELVSVNETASIPLSSTWTNNTVSIKSFKRTTPNAKSSALWPDPANNKLYAWGGRTYNNQTEADKAQLWAFAPDEKGAGVWAPSNPSNPAVFAPIIRTTLGVYTTCKGVGYYLGGEASQYTDGRLKIDDYALPPGLLSYNMSTAIWTNHTKVPSPYATLMHGRAECIPFGDQGLVAFFGGGHRQLNRADSFEPLSFNTISFFNPSTDEWQSQHTTSDSGEFPATRSSFCSVGVAGLNNTFEM